MSEIRTGKESGFVVFGFFMGFYAKLLRGTCIAKTGIALVHEEQ